MKIINGCDYFIDNGKSKSSIYSWKIFKVFLTVGFFSGMRENELIGLKWSDIDYDKKTIKIQRTIDNGIVSKGTKTMNFRNTILLPIVEKPLKEFENISYKKDGFIFVNHQYKTFRNYTNLNKKFKELVEYCGYEKIDLYNMRHSFITLMLSVGKQTEWVLQRVGHADVLTTKGHYIGEIEDRKDLYDKIFNPPKKVYTVTNTDIPISISGNIVENIPTVKFNKNISLS